MRICSLFSSATELLYALGAGRSVVGRSDCCDYPADARRKPVVVRSRIASDRLSSRGIDEAVRAMRRRGEHQYAIDLPLLTRLRPDLVVTQELCNVCAASHPEVLDAIRRLPTKPQVASITAGSLDELLESITALGESIGRPRQAEALQRRLHQDLRVIQHRVRGIRAKPRVWCAEWLDPLMAAGHWVPEMVALAGGIDGLARARMDSVRLPWEEIRRYDPEVILVMPCSFAMARTVNEFPLLKKLPGWSSVSAVRADRVFAIEGAWFHRSGPRLVQGLRLMAALFHPERFPRPSVSRAKALK